MKPILLLIGFLTGSFYGAAIAPAIADDTLTSIKVPCSSDSDPSKFLRRCDVVINGDASHATAPPGIIAQIQKQTDQIINAKTDSIYSGGYTDPTGTQVMTGFPVCDPVASKYNSNLPELANNHNGDSCGRPGYIRVNASSSGINNNVMLYGGGEEWTYLFGLKVPILQCYSAKIQKQITQSQTMSVSPYCQAPAQVLQKLLGQANAAAQAATRSLASLQNINDIWYCDPGMFGSNGLSTTDANAQRPMQSAQDLCNVRSDLESAFTQLAVCEIQAQAEKAFRTIAASPSIYLDSISKTISKKVTSECSHSCDGCDSYRCCSDAATQCANQNYPLALQLHMQNLASQFPSDGSCQ